jgi:hypothetical protein
MDSAPVTAADADQHRRHAQNEISADDDADRVQLFAGLFKVVAVKRRFEPAPGDAAAPKG